MATDSFQRSYKYCIIMFFHNFTKEDNFDDFSSVNLQNWNSIPKKEFDPEGANSFPKDPMTIECGSGFETGKASKCMICKN